MGTPHPPQAVHKGLALRSKEVTESKLPTARPGQRAPQADVTWIHILASLRGARDSMSLSRRDHLRSSRETQFNPAHEQGKPGSGTFWLSAVPAAPLSP